MNANDILVDGFSRVKETLHTIVETLSDTELEWQPAQGANHIAWLAWHVARCIDAQLAALVGDDERWIVEGWNQTFALPIVPSETGYGMRLDDVKKVKANAKLLLAYYDDVHEKLTTYLQTLSAAQYLDIVDEQFSPPVTRGVRLVSILDDCVQHVGQAAYVKGMLSKENS